MTPEAIFARVESPAEYWEALVTAELLPADWLDHPGRRFLCWYCRGGHAARCCTACDNVGYGARPRMCIEITQVARRWRAMAEAEALLAEGLVTLKTLGLGGPAPVLREVRWESHHGILPRAASFCIAQTPARSARDLPRAQANQLRAAGFPPPWRVELYSTGEVQAGTLRRGNVPMRIHCPAWTSSALVRLGALGFRWVRFTEGTADLLYGVEP